MTWSVHSQSAGLTDLGSQIFELKCSRIEVNACLFAAFIPILNCTMILGLAPDGWSENPGRNVDIDSASEAVSKCIPSKCSQVANPNLGLDFPCTESDFLGPDRKSDDFLTRYLVGPDSKAGR
jgi:hypothetical protein